MRTVTTAHRYSGTEDFGDLPISALALPAYDVFTARAAEREIGYLIAGDRRAVLGNSLGADETYEA
jgi:hypothetical protein